MATRQQERTIVSSCITARIPPTAYKKRLHKKVVVKLYKTRVSATRSRGKNTTMTGQEFFAGTMVYKFDDKTLAKFMLVFSLMIKNGKNIRHRN